MPMSLHIAGLPKLECFESVTHRRPQKRFPIACTDPGLFVLLALIATPVLGQAEPPEVTWGERIELASGEAYQGPWRMNESAFHYVDDPTVSLNEAGVVAVAWVDQSRKDIFFQIYSPDGERRFEKPVNVSGTPAIFSWLPRMVITPGNPSAVYLLRGQGRGQIL